MAKSTPGKRPSVITNLICIFAGLCLLWIFKYHNQGLSWHAFRAGNFGNMLSLLLSLGFLLAFTLYNISGAPIQRVNQKTMQVFLFFGIALLLAGKFMSFFSFGQGSYILGQPAKKFYIALCYFIYLYITLFWMIILGLAVLRVKGMLWLRALIHSLLAVFLLLVFAFVHTSPRKSMLALPALKEYDYGVVLGAAVWRQNKPSPVLIARLQKAVSLWNNGSIKAIYLTGSNAPGEISEAEASFNYLKQFDIPLNDIHLERQTTSTTEQIKFISRELLSADRNRQVLVISDKYHVRRIREIVDFYRQPIDVVGADLHLRYEKNLTYRLRESAALLIFWLFGL